MRVAAGVTWGGGGDVCTWNVWGWIIREESGEGVPGNCSEFAPLSYRKCKGINVEIWTSLSSRKVTPVLALHPQVLYVEYE